MPSRLEDVSSKADGPLPSEGYDNFVVMLDGMSIYDVNGGDTVHWHMTTGVYRQYLKQGLKVTLHGVRYE